MADATTLPTLERHTERLLDTARALNDPAAASLCTGWTRAHVLTHIARNADGIAALARAALDGTGETMYASPEQRDADIEAGARRPLAELVDDVGASARALAPLLARLGPEQDELRVARTPGGPQVRIGNLASMRLREVVYHHVDLAAGFGFADVEPDLLQRFLTLETRILGGADPSPDLVLRTDGGQEWVLGSADRETAAADGALVAGSRAAVLGWLARGLTDGVHPPAPPERTWT